MALIKYIIADDHQIFRQGLKYALADAHKLKLVGEAGNGVELLQLVAKTAPDVVLVDIKMPEMDGIEATRQIHERYPNIKILMLTSHDDENFILHLLELGANGYLLKNADPDEIKKAIHGVYENDYYFNDLVNNIMLRTIINKKEIPQKNIVRLTDRETEVLKLICQELTTTEIAQAIFLSPRTIEGIRTALIEKIGVKNAAGLVVYAFRTGLMH